MIGKTIKHPKKSKTANKHIEEESLPRTLQRSRQGHVWKWLQNFDSKNVYIDIIRTNNRHEEKHNQTSVLFQKRHLGERSENHIYTRRDPNGGKKYEETAKHGSGWNPTKGGETSSKNNFEIQFGCNEQPIIAAGVSIRLKCSKVGVSAEK